MIKLKKQFFINLILKEIFQNTNFFPILKDSLNCRYYKWYNCKYLYYLEVVRKLNIHKYSLTQKINTEVNKIHTQDTTLPLWQGNFALSSLISSFTTLKVKYDNK